MNKKSPEIRFKGFTDDWEQRKLGDVSPLRGGYAFQSEKFRSQGVPIIRISNILSDGNIGGNYAFYDEQETDDKYSLPDGAALLAMSGATTGKVAILSNPDNTKFYQNQRVGYFSDLKIVNYDFVSTIVKSNLFISQLSSVLVAGAQPNVSSKEIDSFGFYFPKTLKEQTKLGIFFKQLDETIVLHQDAIQHQQDLKKAMLQKLFPVNGARIPTVRFATFKEEWEQRKLGEVGSVVMCKRIFKDQTTAFGDIPFYKIGTFGGNPDSFIPNELFEEYKKNYPYPEIGDILMSASGTIGRTIVYEGEKAYYQDSNIVWLKTDKSLIDNSFLKQFYQVVKWSGLEGSTIKRLYNSNILSTGINLPSLKEQTKLGTFFNQLDNTIALHQQALDKLKLLKQSLLQKMFV